MEHQKELRFDKDMVRNGASVFRALNNKFRQELIKAIHVSERTNVSALRKRMHLEQAVTSMHLSILRRAKFVNTQKEGKEIYYSINYVRFAEVDYLLKQILQ